MYKKIKSWFKNLINIQPKYKEFTYIKKQNSRASHIFNSDGFIKINADDILTKH